MNEETLFQLELSLIANESLMTALVAKWHGKPSGIAEDIYSIASTIYKQNKGNTNSIKKEKEKEKESFYNNPYSNIDPKNPYSNPFNRI